MRWQWEPNTQRYRDLDTGRFVSRARIKELVADSIHTSQGITDTLSSLLADNRLAVGDWQAAMRQEIKDEYIRQYLLGRGGLSQMTQEDWGSIGGMIADQYRYLDNFAAEIASGNLSE